MPIQTTGERASGISVVAYAFNRPETVLPPDTSHLDLVYGANTGTILTRSQEAHGIDAQHSRGGTVIVENSGTVEVRGDRAVGIYAGSSGGETSVEDCTVTHDGQPATDPATQCSRTYQGGDVTVINQGDITASGTNRRGEGTGIGISAESDGGDVVIRSSGSISASAVGIRAETSTQGTITIEVTGTLDAPVPLQVIGGNDGNSIVTPPIRQTKAALDRTTADLTTPPARLGSVRTRNLDIAGGRGAPRLGVGDEHRFAQVDLLPAGASGRLGASHIHTPGFVDVLAARTDVSVAAVWDPDPAIAEKYAARLQCRAALDVETVLGVPDLDAVIVLSQTNRHEELVHEIARANKHCFVEKPLGIGLAKEVFIQAKSASTATAAVPLPDPAHCFPPASDRPEFPEPAYVTRRHRGPGSQIVTSTSHEHSIVATYRGAGADADVPVLFIFGSYARWSPTAERGYPHHARALVSQSDRGPSAAPSDAAQRLARLAASAG